ncbi:MAG: tRNA pseudouridine(13) synthase TruD [Methanohalobium sp.]|uniref:tRNA pseudouridine(13) synthase TruD n=1 Tax=Methanohalobium sp. TaxID=2837493 RepID=UPI0039793B92
MKVPEIEKKIGTDLYVTSTNGIGGTLRQKTNDFIVEEITNRTEGNSGKYLIIKLKKSNWETHHLIRDLSRKLGISQKRIGFAGTKDKKAVTTQKISIHDLNPEYLDNIFLKDVEMSVIGRSNKSVELGDLTGNKFKITIRDINLDVGDTYTRLENIKKDIQKIGGVPNFFGVQRFGSTRPVTHLVGEYLVRGDPEGAALKYIADAFPDEPDDTASARNYVYETRDYVEGLKRYPLRLRYERSMMDYLIKNPDDYTGAFNVLPRNIQRIFVHAYQSYLFNRIVCQRIKEELSLNQSYEGDIVCFKNKAGLPDTSRLQEVTSTNINGMNNLIRRRRAFVTAPLIGYQTDFSSGKPGEIEKKVFEETGLSVSDFKLLTTPELASKGVRREILLHAVPSFEVDVDDLNPGKSKAVLDFTLPKGSYATTLLREHMKVNPLKMS